jgi:hypothetical protein
MPNIMFLEIDANQSNRPPLTSFVLLNWWVGEQTVPLDMASDDSEERRGRESLQSSARN